MLITSLEMLIIQLQNFSAYAVWLPFIFTCHWILEGEKKKVRLTVAPADLITMYLFFKSRDANILDNLKSILYPLASSNWQNYF